MAETANVTPAKKNPSSVFYWNDWDGDPALRACSMAAQGFWMRCLCIAARAPEFGVVMIGSAPAAIDAFLPALARSVGESPKVVAGWVKELLDTEAASVDDKGRLVCRRMVRSAEVSAARSAAGREGGSKPKQKGSKPPSKPEAKDEAKPEAKPQANDQASSRLPSSTLPTSGFEEPPSLVAEVPEDDFGEWPAENQDGAAVTIRPPSDNRLHGQRGLGDVIDRIVQGARRPEKRLKNQKIADVHIANWLMTNGGMDAGKAWDLVTTARDPDHPDQTDCARYLEKLSRKHTLGWFSEEMA